MTPSPIPRPVFADESTVPVDVDTMDLAARRSQFALDPKGGNRTLRSGTVVRREEVSGRGAPIASVSIAGVPGAVDLRLRNVSATGIVLELELGDVPALEPGTAVSVQVRWSGETDAGLAQLRLAGTVAHRRDPTDSVPGGMSIRWSRAHGAADKRIHALVTALRNTAQ